MKNPPSLPTARPYVLKPALEDARANLKDAEAEQIKSGSALQQTIEIG